MKGILTKLRKVGHSDQLMCFKNIIGIIADCRLIKLTFDVFDGLFNVISHKHHPRVNFIVIEGSGVCTCARVD